MAVSVQPQGFWGMLEPVKELELFPSYFYKITDPDFHEYQEGLVEWLTEYAKDKKGRTVSNYGGFQSDSSFVYEPGFEAYWERLNTVIGHVIANHLERDHLRDFPTYNMSSCWYNINYKDNFNRCHNHPGCDLSAVFWVSGDSGRLVFPNPNIHSQWSTFRYSCAEFEPEPGTLLIFPSNMDHWVEPNKSDKPRISIAANFNLSK